MANELAQLRSFEPTNTAAKIQLKRPTNLAPVQAPTGAVKRDHSLNSAD